jgi:ABC-type branched-subunit amino acid transport system ATPase component
MILSYALELESVSRHFGALKAIDDVSIRVGSGERYAILGSNGAGKTTCSIPFAATSRRPAAGSASSART